MRAVASLEAGAISRATIMAMTRSRGRLPAGPSMRSRPMSRSVPSTAATWPRGNVRRTMMFCWLAGVVVPPLRSVRSPSTSSLGQSERFAMVRFLIFAPSQLALAQQDGRRRIPVRDGFDIHGVVIIKTKNKL